MARKKALVSRLCRSKQEQGWPAHARTRRCSHPPSRTRPLAACPQLDGFDGRPGVLVIAATNRPETLDPALLRPGRLTRRVTVPLPDEEGRRDILRVHLRRVPLQGVMLEEAAETLARITPNCSGAELANVVNEGALMAGRRGADGVVMADLLEGVQVRVALAGGRGA